MFTRLQVCRDYRNFIDRFRNSTSFIQKHASESLAGQQGRVDKAVILTWQGQGLEELYARSVGYPYLQLHGETAQFKKDRDTAARQVAEAYYANKPGDWRAVQPTAIFPKLEIIQLAANL